MENPELDRSITGCVSCSSRVATNRGDISNHGNDLWKAIWGENKEPKVKNYIWRLASNAVAVKANLQRRGMMVDPGCPVCEEDETTEHMVFGCSWTKPVGGGGADGDQRQRDTVTRHHQLAR